MIRFIQTREISDYKSVINGLLIDFDYVFLHTILQWCKLAHDPYEKENQFWELYLVKYRFKTIGICGLYSLKPNSTDELWLGWLGLIPEYRNKGNGKFIIDFLELKAKEQDCKKLLSYVDKEGKALSFYEKHNFKVIGTVKTYLEQTGNKKIDGKDFEHPEDFVIEKELTYQ